MNSKAVLALLACLVMAPPCFATAKSDARRLRRVAHAIWPDVPLYRLQAWAESRPSDPGLFVHDPAERTAELIRTELAARANGTTPDAARLHQTIEAIFEAARRSDGEVPTTPFGQKARRQLDALGVQIVGSGTAAVGACAQLFGHTPLFTTMIYGGLGLTAVTVTYVAANLMFDNLPALPGRGYLSERRSLVNAMSRLSNTVAERLRDAPEWRRAFPNVDPAPICDDFAGLLRSVWTPGDLRRAAVDRFGRAP